MAGRGVAERHAGAALIRAKYRAMPPGWRSGAIGPSIDGETQAIEGFTMKLSDERLEEIRAWLCGESKQDPAGSQEEMAAIANELKQLRLRTSSGSRSAAAPSRSVGH
jgi:hypothetical protein